MSNERQPCCIDLARKAPCGTRWAELRVWASATTGKGVRVVTLQGEEQGKTPYFAQPVGFDGRTIFLAADSGCDTEKLLHEVCHWLMSPKQRRGLVNYGLGPLQRDIDDVTADNEEVSVMLLEKLLAPHFRLADERIARPDYNVSSKRTIDWVGCEARAQVVYAAHAGAMRH